MRGKPSPPKGLESPNFVEMSSLGEIGRISRWSRCTLKMISEKRVGEKVWVQEATPLSLTPPSVAAFALPSRWLALHPARSYTNGRTGCANTGRRADGG